MLYVAYTDGEDLDPDAQGPWRGIFALHAGLALVDSEQSRSVVYHAIKDQLPRDTPLLVAACPQVPKFKKMRPGALAWARRRVEAN